MLHAHAVICCPMLSNTHIQTAQYTIISPMLHVDDVDVIQCLLYVLLNAHCILFMSMLYTHATVV